MPSLKKNNINSKNIVKVVATDDGSVLYLSRSSAPFYFRKKEKTLLKHLSIISFKPEALKKFFFSKQTKLEKIEGVELLRALELGIKIKTLIQNQELLISKDYTKESIFLDNSSIS